MTAHAAFLGHRDSSNLESELAELGGEIAIRQLAHQLVSEGGETTAHRAVLLIHQVGGEGLRLLTRLRHSTIVLEALSTLEINEVLTGVRTLLGIQGHLLEEAIQEYGAVALRAELRHPGLGLSIVRQLGPEGAMVADHLEMQQTIWLASHATQITCLPLLERRGLLELLRRHPAEIVGFDNRHPNFLLNAPTVAWLLNNEDLMLSGAAVVFDNQGNPHLVEKPGWFSRFLWVQLLHFCIIVMLSCAVTLLLVVIRLAITRCRLQL
jgi:hypothetical protein